MGLPWNETSPPLSSLCSECLLPPHFTSIGNRLSRRRRPRELGGSGVDVRGTSSLMTNQPQVHVNIIHAAHSTTHSIRHSNTRCYHILLSVVARDTSGVHSAKAAYENLRCQSLTIAIAIDRYCWCWRPSPHNSCILLQAQSSSTYLL